ncbi:hypothetical protein Tco_1484937 [Tanacetum coccineum]
MDGTLVDGNLVPLAFINHYTEFLGQPGMTSQFDSNDLFCKRLSNEAASFMIREVSDKEIKVALFSLGDNKAPGPDGYSTAFFKEAWDIISVDVCKAIKEFFTNGVLLKELNHTIIALISKVASPLRINDFRLILCCNVLFKFISKIISNRMKERLSELFSLNHYAFVPGRRISDNILFTQELMHNYHLDRGLVFILYCSNLNIINLCFADDLFLFAHGDVDSARVIIDSLDEFKNASGLTLSLPKSTTYFCNVLNHVKLGILNILPFEEGKLPVKYLGVSLVPSRLVHRDCLELMERIKKRVSDWKNKSLSFAGRTQLIHSVLSSMHLYWASVFILPYSLMLKLEQVMRGFLWCQGEIKKGKAKVAWEVVCLPKKKEGSELDDWMFSTKLLFLLIYGAFFQVRNHYGLNGFTRIN